MRLMDNDPELQLLTWWSDERALQARLEIRRQLGPRPPVTSQLCAALLQTVGMLLMRCGQWLTGQVVDFAAPRSTCR